ncbi:MAG: acyltransferase family protein [Candidatus Thorarchaeota archaeon]|jgi:peptidoglycan/LPS O-acetylase OafA/YrhL
METGQSNSDISESKYQRRYELDWLRIIAVILVWVFHNIITFRVGGWTIYNDDVTFAANASEILLGGFGMPFFSVVSGMAIYHLIEKLDIQKLRSTTTKLLIKARFIRLMIPFLVGVFTYISLMEYYSGLQLGTVTGSYLDFYLQRYFLEGWKNQGGWFLPLGHHLWYLLILFAWSVVALPLFIQLRTERNRERLAKLAAFVNRPGAIYLLVIPIIVIELLNPFTQVMFDLGPGGMRQGGWHILTYLVLLIYGYIFASNRHFEDALEKHSFPALLVAIFLGIILVPIWIALTASGLLNILGAPPELFLLMVIYCWSMIIVIISFGKRRLSFNHKWLKFLNRIAMPFYILHYVVSIAVQFYVVELPIGIFEKFLLITGISFVIIVGLALIIRQFNVLRFLFGMSIRKRTSSITQEPPPIAGSE